MYLSVLATFALSFIIISASLVAGCVQAVANIDNKSNIMLHDHRLTNLMMQISLPKI